MDVLISFPAWEADPILGRATQLRESVTLRAEQTALGKAFKAFDLDPNVPDHWHRLINYFARAHFEPRPAGAKAKWTAKRRIQLLIDVRSAAKQMTSFDLNCVASRIIRDPTFDRDTYAAMSVDSLVRQIYFAIKWVNDAQKAR